MNRKKKGKKSQIFSCSFIFFSRGDSRLYVCESTHCIRVYDLLSGTGCKAQTRRTPRAYFAVRLQCRNPCSLATCSATSSWRSTMRFFAQGCSTKEAPCSSRRNSRTFILTGVVWNTIAWVEHEFFVATAMVLWLALSAALLD